MIKASSPKPASAPITGADYNQLYEDVFANHAHSAIRDGGLIDHDHLIENGNPMTSYNSHTQIDAHISAGAGVHGIPPTGGIIYQVGAGTSKFQAGKALHGGWSLTGPPWYSQYITFAEAFSSPPVIVCTPVMGGSQIDRMHLMVNEVTVSGFRLWALGGAMPDNQYEDVGDQNVFWMALGA